MALKHTVLNVLTIIILLFSLLLYYIIYILYYIYIYYIIYIYIAHRVLVFKIIQAIKSDELVLFIYY